MWTYQQTTGNISGPRGFLWRGYAGKGVGRNNSAMQGVRLEGPLPQGLYTIGPPHDHPRLGKYVMALTPDAGNQMYGRSGFFIHGDNPAHPDASSDGCIVLSHAARLSIWNNGGDKRLQVVD